MENKKVLLSVKDLEVKFRVRGRTLTAIRGVSLDFYENEDRKRSAANLAALLFFGVR